MKNIITPLISALLLISVIAVGQDLPTMDLNDSTNVRKKDYDQQYDYENYMTAFAPKKKNTWAIGLNGGLAILSGDVRSNLGYGGGLTIQKALGHVMSLRLQGLYAINDGQDWKPTSIVTDSYRNYETQMADVSLQGVFALNNINFYKKQPKVIVYMFAGGGVFWHETKLDLTAGESGDAAYNYASIYDNADIRTDKDKTLDALNDLQDGNAETNLEDAPHVDKNDINNINPSLVGGMGLSFRLGGRVDLNLEQRFSWHGTDYIDGYNRDREGGLSAAGDILSYTSLGFNFKIGKREEALWWSNPLFTPYDDIRELKSSLYKGTFLKDEDEDGVMDVYDKDLNTPPDVLVNTKGVALDIDKDGVADHIDKEPFTPKGARIYDNGVAVDSDDDGVPDIYDKKSNSTYGALVDAKGIDIEQSETTTTTVSNDFGVVFFDFNSSVVKKEFYPEVYKVANYMKANPNVNIKVVGHTDNRASSDYNKRLAEKRAANVVKVLVESFGFDESRFTTMAMGEEDAFVDGLPDNRKSSKHEGSHYLNRRVTFEVAR